MKDQAFGRGLDSDPADSTDSGRELGKIADDPTVDIKHPALRGRYLSTSANEPVKTGDQVIVRTTVDFRASTSPHRLGIHLTTIFADFASRP